jgi:hypothetical protein
MVSPATDKTIGKPKRKHRWFQFGLASLLGLVTLSGIGLALIVSPAQRQRRAVEAIESMGGRVQYEFLSEATVAPEWLQKLVGEGYFRPVTDVSLYNTQVSDAGLAHVKGLPGLQWLSLHNTQVGDAGLEHLKGLASLESLGLKNTQVSDAGVAELQMALPNCFISASRAVSGTSPRS